jgi:protein involved in polysaccharide export with SLBB domain
MKFIFKLGFTIFLITCSFTFAQAEDQVKQKLQQEGIKNKSDVMQELQKRNMTEDNARRMAKQYGMDYETFIQKYIMQGKDSTVQTSNKEMQTAVQKQAEQKDSIEEKPVITKEEKEKLKPIVETPVSELGGLKYFGYDLFKEIPASFEPAAVGPIDPGYLIGPGDVLRIYLWGAVEFQYELTVDNQGTIFIPTAGQFFVSGVAYSDLQIKLTHFLSKFYEGLNANPPTVFLDISIAKLRPIKIFVMGEVARPGGYNVSSFATVFNALYSIGGPMESGSLREIRVIRNNKVLTKVDIYDYLLKGQLIGDVRLQNNDMIFIPPRGKTVGLKGEILRPAYYEVKPDENFKKLLEYAGGLKSTAYIGRASVERIIPFEERKKFELEKEIIDINLSEIITNKTPDFQLADGDIITLYLISEKIENFVTIKGSVFRPGKYDISQVANISDLVSKAEGVKPDTYFEKADIFRTRLDLSLEFITINLKKALEGDPENNLKLQKLDKVKIYSIWDLIDRKNVSISGYVKNPTTLPYADSLTLYDLVFGAGGLQDPFFRGKAFLLRGDLIRVNPDGLTTSIIPFDLEKLLYDKSVNINLMPGDRVIIYSGDVDKVLDKFVSIKGEVKNPGKFPLSTNMCPSDLILMAGGFTEQSLRTEVYVNRVRPNGYPGEKISETFKVTLPLTFLKEKVEDNQDTISVDNNKYFRLQYNDIVVVRKNPNYEPQRIVNIRGDVKFPGVYVIENRNETVLDLLNKAGGPNSEGFLFGAVYTRAGKRLNVNLEELYMDKNQKHNIYLSNNDDIFIPKKPNTVFVTGEVNHAGLFKFVEGESVKDYIEKAGGRTDSANFAVYLKPNGESQKVNFGWFTSDPEVFDGSIIEVTRIPPEPKSEITFDLGITVRDVFAIVVSAVTIIVLARQIK